MVHLKNVSKQFDGKQVIEDVSLEIPTGQTTVLIGPSGCGKSTLLRMVAGLILPDYGEVVVGDTTLSQSTLSDIRQRLGYVIQDGGLFPHLTARDNVTISARRQNWSAETIEDRLQELAELTHFPIDAFDRFPKQLSGGQRQRLGLMRALMTHPEILLMDEPLGALDPIVRHELQQDLKQVFESLTCTVLFVTHDLHEADFFADEIVLLEAGRIEQRGQANDLANNPVSPFVTKFVEAQPTGSFGKATS